MPTNPWQPKNAPPLKQEFTTKSAPPTPVSKPEMETLKTQRDKPPQLTLQPKPPAPVNTPPTPVDEIKRNQTVKERETRIQHIQERLSRQQGRAQTAFQKANVTPKPDPVSKQEVKTQKREISDRQARVDYLQQRLASKRDRARNAFNRSR